MAKTLMDLQSGLANRAALGDPFGNQNITDYFARRPQNPLSPVDPIKQFLDQQNDTPVPPGYQERFGDPTKVISGIPPSINQPAPRVAPTGGRAPLLPGWSYAD